MTAMMRFHNDYVSTKSKEIADKRHYAKKTRKNPDQI